jgi:hypothetical protein
MPRRERNPSTAFWVGIGIALGWAMGAGDVPLERAIWVGDPDVIWKDITERTEVVELKLGTAYEIPVTPPDPVMAVSVSSTDETALTPFESAFEDAGAQYVVLHPVGMTEATVTVVQGDWKKHATFRVVQNGEVVG